MKSMLDFRNVKQRVNTRLDAKMIIFVKKYAI